MPNRIDSEIEWFSIRKELLEEVIAFMKHDSLNEDRNYQSGRLVNKLEELLSSPQVDGGTEVRESLQNKLASAEFTIAAMDESIRIRGSRIEDLQKEAGSFRKALFALNEKLKLSELRENIQSETKSRRD